MISIICVYNDRRVLEDYLLKSLADQTADYELIAIDNRSMDFRSASRALNHGWRRAKGEYIMFVHQDVDLHSRTWLADSEKMLDALPGPWVAGVAGCSENGIATIMEHGVPPRSPADIVIDGPVKVQTVDECLVLVRRDLPDVPEFDEDLCDGWHLYAADLCLRCKMRGFEVYALPLYVYHLSRGGANKNILEALLSLSLYPKEYYTTLEKLLHRYGNHYQRIYTTCGVWDTSKPLLLQRCLRFLDSGPRYAADKIRRWITRHIDRLARRA